MEELKKPKVVGKIDQRVVDLLGLSDAPDTPILLGKTNVEHMKNEHPEDFEKYFHELENIIKSPDYVAMHPKDGSVQYIKIIDVHVIVGVRVSSKGIYFARSIYGIKERRFENYSRAGTIKKY